MFKLKETMKNMPPLKAMPLVLAIAATILTFPFVFCLVALGKVLIAAWDLSEDLIEKLLEKAEGPE